MLDLKFYQGKKVLITGHTGFKGTWLCAVLLRGGAEVAGYALEPSGSPSIFELSKMKNKVNSITGDVRDIDHLKKIVREIQPEIIIHMAAQPIVRESYRNPVYTYETNIMGTVNILECARVCDSVRSLVNVTTDKVYLNREWEWGYRENEELNGYDPYSNSKSCSELVTNCYRNSFFLNENVEKTVAVSTIRAGNVIGGGDFSVDRIIPDCVRAALGKKAIIVRNPYSIRPYQFVLEPLMVYLMIAQKQYQDIRYAGSYNVGPCDNDCLTTGRLATLFCDYWERIIGEKIYWENVSGLEPHEANYLKLDCTKLRTTFKWEPTWGIEKAMNKVVEWTKFYLAGEDVSKCMDRQIEEFLTENLNFKIF